MLTRAIEPDAASAAGPLVVAIVPTVTIAAIERHRISPEIVSAFCARSVSEALSDYINCDAI
jgi:hypothetical protein